MNAQATSKFVIASVRWILPKVRVDRFTRPRREIDIRYEFDFELHWKNLGGKWKLLQSFSAIFPMTSKFAIFFVRLILGKVEVDGFTEPRRKIDIRHEFGFNVIFNF